MFAFENPSQDSSSTENPEELTPDSLLEGKELPVEERKFSPSVMVTMLSENPEMALKIFTKEYSDDDQVIDAMNELIQSVGIKLKKLDGQDPDAKELRRQKRNLEDALDQYKRRHGHYPNHEDEK